jgi:N-acetylmuramoyl-L-alanine amidase
MGRGATGPAVGDLQRRLAAAGITLDDDIADEAGVFGPATDSAVRRFQADRGLDVDGVCGPQTWGSLVEAGWRLGDRFLYLRRPMLRGDDVADLQARLGALGFHHGRIDGIFGPDSTEAVREFQRNTALVTDGIFGRDTAAALARLSAKASVPANVGDVRARAALESEPRRLAGRRVVVGETGGLDALATSIARSLQDAGAQVVVLHHPDGSAQAAEANQNEAELYLGVRLQSEPGYGAAFFGTPRWESPGGRALADLVVDELQQRQPLEGPGGTRPMAIPVLRETRMPAVVCEVGPPATVVANLAALAAALGQAVTRWAEEPLER